MALGVGNPIVITDMNSIMSIIITKSRLCACNCNYCPCYCNHCACYTNSCLCNSHCTCNAQCACNCNVCTCNVGKVEIKLSTTIINKELIF